MMLKSGVSISKIALFQELLEEKVLALTSVSNMRQLLPLPTGKVKAAIRGRPISILYHSCRGNSHGIKGIFSWLVYFWRCIFLCCFLLPRRLASALLCF